MMLLTVFAYASDNTAGIDFPQKMKAGDIDIVLNGTGLRKKFFIKVYAAGLYLENPESAQEAILSSDSAIAIRMVMIHDNIAPEKLSESWKEGFEANTEDTAPLIERINTLTGWFTETARKGDVYDIIYVPNVGSSLTINGVLKGTIEGADFRKALFAIWLGDKPADENLKKAMLGK